MAHGEATTLPDASLDLVTFAQSWPGSHRGQERPSWPGSSGPAVESHLVDWVQTTTPAALAQLVTTRSSYRTATPAEQRRILAASTELVTARCGETAKIAVPHRTAIFRTRRES